MCHKLEFRYRCSKDSLMLMIFVIVLVSFQWYSACPLLSCIQWCIFMRMFLVYHIYTMCAYISKLRIGIFQESAGVDCIH